MVDAAMRRLTVAASLGDSDMAGQGRQMMTDGQAIMTLVSRWYSGRDHTRHRARADPPLLRGARGPASRWRRSRSSRNASRSWR